jgi:phosphate/sulfate permease
MQETLTQIPATQVALVVALVLVLLQEAVNGFHDTANAIAAAVYSNSIEARWAVVMAATLNFVGVMSSGCAVAFAMVYLLPVEMVAGIGTMSEIAFLLALVVTAVLWNTTTWYLGIPNSTTHTYVGAILGVTAAHAFVHGQSISAHMHWHEGEKVIAALVVSPIIGFVLASLIYRGLKRFVKDEQLFEPSETGRPPKTSIRALMIAGAAGISFLHGTNDGQKSIGFMFLVLVGIAPTLFGLDQKAGPEAYQAIQKSTVELEQLADRLANEPAFAVSAREMQARAKGATAILANYDSLAKIPEVQENEIRRDLLYLQRDVSRISKAGEGAGVLTQAEIGTLGDARKNINRLLENVPDWLMALSATFLGLGTAIGYKRIVITLGEKMSSVKMNAAHGTATQLTAIACIALADTSAVPVSTTHVVTSGVAGSMRASGAGLQVSTLRGIIITWFTTLPGCFMLSFAFAIMLHAAFT